MSTSFYECDTCGFTGNGGLMIQHQKSNPSHSTSTQTQRRVGKTATRKKGVNLLQSASSSKTAVQTGQSQPQE